MTARKSDEQADYEPDDETRALIAQYRGNIETAITMLMNRSRMLKRDLAEAIGVSTHVIGRRFVNAVDFTDWDVEELARVCAYFGVDLVDLLEPWRLNEKPTKVVTSGGKKYFPTTTEPKARLALVESN